MSGYEILTHLAANHPACASRSRTFWQNSPPSFSRPYSTSSLPRSQLTWGKCQITSRKRSWMSHSKNVVLTGCSLPTARARVVVAMLLLTRLRRSAVEGGREGVRQGNEARVWEAGEGMAASFASAGGGGRCKSCVVCVVRWRGCGSEGGMKKDGALESSAAITASA